MRKIKLFSLDSTIKQDLETSKTFRLTLRTQCKFSYYDQQGEILLVNLLKCFPGYRDNFFLHAHTCTRTEGEFRCAIVCAGCQKVVQKKVLGAQYFANKTSFHMHFANFLVWTSSHMNMPSAIFLEVSSIILTIYDLTEYIYWV